jgi:hypothetical protein
MAASLRLLPALLSFGLLAAASQPSALAQQQGYGQTMEGVSGTGGGASGLGPGLGTGKGGNVLDAVNPIDLMNRIRRSQSLDDATPPGDAVDQALRDYHGQMAAPASPSQGVKGP